jgi:hypothetical protein
LYRSSLENILKNFPTSYFPFKDKDNFMYIRLITLRKDNIDDFNDTLKFYLNQFYVFTLLYTSTTFFDAIRKEKCYQLFFYLDLHTVYYILNYLCLSYVE